MRRTYQSRDLLHFPEIVHWKSGFWMGKFTPIAGTEMLIGGQNG
jgi:hypothetical protein